MYIGDLHIHSRYSRATSRDLTPESLDFWAARKGIHLVGTGDFTHPAWREELKEKLKPAEDGLYVLDPSLRRREEVPGSSVPRFVISGEISSIYKKNGKVRKVHSLILLPGLEEAQALSGKLETIGNIHSDGRPILGLDCRDLLEITLEICPRAIYIPAHIWTPHFSLFGAFSGFDRIEECFEDMTPYIHALETGLSSDPLMNWNWSALDSYFLVSNSDAHSPLKLGREANLLDIEMSYEGLYQALQAGKGLAGTIEFFPEEGKYHYDGHRKCHVCLSPKEAEALGNRCPVCGKKLTIGVDHRVEQLADREETFRPENARDFESLVPLPENMVRKLGTEFEILRNVPAEEIGSQFGPMIGEGISRLREGRVKRLPGFDGEYGVIRLFEPWEIEELEGQISLFSLFGMKSDSSEQETKGAKRKEAAEMDRISENRRPQAEFSPKSLPAEESAAASSGQTGADHGCGSGTRDGEDQDPGGADSVYDSGAANQPGRNHRGDLYQPGGGRDGKTHSFQTSGETRAETHEDRNLSLHLLPHAEGDGAEGGSAAGKRAAGNCRRGNLRAGTETEAIPASGGNFPAKDRGKGSL